MLESQKNTLASRIYQDTKALMVLALPILGAQLSTTAMSFADTSMSGQIGPNSLAAIAIGSSLWIPVYVFIIGVLMALTPIIAQLYAGQKQDQIGENVRQGLWISAIFTLIVIGLLFHADKAMVLLKINPSIIPLAAAYLKALCWGVPAMAFYACLCRYCEGMADTKPGCVFGIIGLGINVLANYMLVYGKWGAPRLGAVGCGYATAASLWIMLILLIVYLTHHPRHKPNQLFSNWCWPNFTIIKGLIILGVPIGLSIFSETLLFSIIALLIGFMGPVIVSGHQLSLNFSSLVFMLPLSLSIANTIRVGYSVGEKKPHRARFVSCVGIGVAVFCAVLSAVMTYSFPEPIAHLYTKNQEVVEVARHLLFYAALFQIVDAIQSGATGALRGYKDTFWPLCLSFFSYWGIAFPIGYGLGLTHWFGNPMGPQGLWTGLVIGLCCSAIFNGSRLFIISKRYILCNPTS